MHAWRGARGKSVRSPALGPRHARHVHVQSTEACALCNNECDIIICMCRVIFNLHTHMRARLLAVV